MLGRTLVCLCILASMLTGCSLFGQSCVCTTEFRLIPVDVVDQGNQPVDGATLTITNVQTGNEMTVNGAGDMVPGKGTYIIGDDGILPQINEHGTPVRVVVKKGQMSATADFVLGTDECRCHVQKLSGPDVMTLTE